MTGAQTFTRSFLVRAVHYPRTLVAHYCRSFDSKIMLRETKGTPHRFLPLARRRHPQLLRQLHLSAYPHFWRFEGWGEIRERRGAPSSFGAVAPSPFGAGATPAAASPALAAPKAGGAGGGFSSLSVGMQGRSFSSPALALGGSLPQKTPPSFSAPAAAPLFAAAAPNVTPHACSPSAATTLRYEKVLKQLSALASGPSTTTTAPV